MNYNSGLSTVSNDWGRDIKTHNSTYSPVVYYSANSLK